ncbi:asparagine synthase (glutamine-hydrolyzing), partial [Candidatus Parcubacteria bacterium]
FLARDHFGVKPLFYYYDGKRLIFASEIKAILKHQIKRELNWRQINLFFHLLYSKGPETVWQKIYKLPPGHYLRWRRGIGLEIKKYWQLNSSAPRFGNIEEIQENIRELLRSSVARQLVADVPVGVFLSGGIDSTAILGLMAERTRAPIKTFSVGFKVDQRNFEKFNQDAILARLTAGRYNAEHYEVMLGPEEVIQHFEKVVWHMDDLVYSPTQVANFVLAKLARRYVKVVLGGDGGDELFGGYRRYYYYWWYQHLRIIPSWLRGSAAVRRLFEFWGQDKAVNRLNLEPQELHWSFMSQKDRLLNQVLRPDLQKFTLNAKQYFYQDGLFNQPLEGDFVNKMMIFDLKTWLPDFSLARTDKMGMAVGLEERVPFLDKHLADFAMQIPSRFKIGNASGGKKVLRQALRGYLPPEIYKKDKSGWITPTAKWIRGGLKDYIQEVLSDSFSQEDGNLIDWQQARRLFTQHLAGRVYAPHIIWSLVTFRVWYKMFKQI